MGVCLGVLFHSVGDGAASFQADSARKMGPNSVPKVTFFAVQLRLSCSVSNFLLVCTTCTPLQYHKYGVGAMQVKFSLQRHSTNIVRFNLLPMIVVGMITASIPMLDDDSVAQVSWFSLSVRRGRVADGGICC